MRKECFIIIQDKSGYNPLYLSSFKKHDYYWNAIHFYYTKNGWMVSLLEGAYFPDGSKTRLLNKSFYLDYEQSYEKTYVYVFENKIGYDDFKLYAKQSFSEKDFKLNKEMPVINFSYSANTNQFNSNYICLRNGQIYKGEYIENGDVIECLGLRFVQFQDALYINNFYGICLLKESKVNENNGRILKKDKQILILDKSIDLEAHFPPYPVLKRKDKRDNSFKERLLSSFTISLAMAIMAGINIYNSILANRGINEIIAVAIFPLAMVLSSLIIPCLLEMHKSCQIKKTNILFKQQYDFEISQTKKIIIAECNRLKEELELLFPDYKKIIKYLKSGFVFYEEVKNNSIQINLGHYSKQFLEEPYPDELIEASIIHDYPLLMDLKGGELIFIEENVKDNHLYLKTLLISLLTRYHHKNFKIALCGKWRNIFSELKDIKQLHDGTRRLFFDDLGEAGNYLNNLNYYTLILFDEYVDISLNNRCFGIFAGKIAFNTDGYKVIKVDKGSGQLFDKKITLFYYSLHNFNLSEICEELVGYSPANYYQKNFISFADAFGYKSIKEIEPLDFYEENHAGLKAHFAVYNNKAFALDLHESKDGPHGLIGGFTGSGKSELLISLLLSLCVYYPPEKLALIIIDYKGSQIADSLSYKSQRIPHILAEINNLNNDSNNRFLAGLNTECRKRQLAFSNLAKLVHKAINGIDDYNYLAPEYGLELMPNIIIVVDEFAELKQKNMNFISELISISRIGRSLGFHLLLATQKPASCIDDEIWSNARFKIGLKMQEERDSRELLKDNCAVLLKNPGDFWLLKDGIKRQGKAVYGRINCDNSAKKEVILLDNNANEQYKVISGSDGESEIQYLCSKIIKARQSFTQKTIIPYRPEALEGEKLLAKYNENRKNYKLYLGESDLYLTGQNALLSHDYRKGAALFYGNGRNKDVILNELSYAPLPILYIGYDNNIPNNAELIEPLSSAFKRLFIKIKANKKPINRILFIEDLASLFAQDESTKEVISNLLPLCRLKGILPIFFTQYIETIPYRILHYFDHRYSLIDASEDASRLFFGKIIKSPCAYQLDTFIDFVPIKNNQPNLKATHKPYLNDLLNIKPKIKDDKILIGLDLKSEEEVYACNINIIANKNLDLLEPYKSYAEKISILKDNENNMRYSEILYIGEGILRQRYKFLPKRELNKGEVYYLNGEGGRILYGLSKN